MKNQIKVTTEEKYIKSPNHLVISILLSLSFIKINASNNKAGENINL
ncbi:MAG: hypothetical protein LBQ59_04085 [Candidatus Peribacteria bacterium]|nr:hypothetical protein [Candidatus Peribacteria bacterium]